LFAWNLYLVGNLVYTSPVFTEFKMFHIAVTFF